jgi:hypothetical protein
MWPGTLRKRSRRRRSHSCLVVLVIDYVGLMIYDPLTTVKGS